MAASGELLEAERERLRLTWALGRVAAGDQAALEELYRRTSAKVLGVITRVVGPGQEAEDVMQEVYVTVWRKAGSFDPDRGVGPLTWLAAIARNRAIDRLRSQSKRRTEALERADNVADPAVDAFSALSSAEDGRRLAACLDVLEPKRAQSIRVAYFEGLTYEAVARRLETPIGTVKSWIRRGLAELRACLEQ